MASNGKKQLAAKLYSSVAKANDRFKKAHTKHVLKYKLTAPQYGVLAVLSSSGPVPLKRISEELMVTGANITCVIDNLEKEKLVQRIPSKEDRRVIMADLTKKGKEKVSTIMPGYLETLAGTGKNLNETEQKQLLKLLEKFLAN